MRTSGKAILFAIGVAAMVEGAPRVSLAQGTWCSLSHDRDIGPAENCSFSSFEQCLATARGMGAICARNQAVPEPKPATQRLPNRPRPAAK